MAMRCSSDIRDPEHVPSGELLALAILADGVFESFDLAVFCVEALVTRGVVENSVLESYIEHLPDSLVRPMSQKAAE